MIKMKIGCESESGKKEKGQSIWVENERGEKKKEKKKMD